MSERRGFPLSYTEALTVKSLVRNRRRAIERQRAKKPFTPEPGRRDMALLSIQRLDGLEERLMRFIEESPEYDASEWEEDE